MGGASRSLALLHCYDFRWLGLTLAARGHCERSASLAVYLHANSLQFPIAVERLLGNTGINKEPCVNHGLSRNCKYRKQL
jgi:hypothetical protein